MDDNPDEWRLSTVDFAELWAAQGGVEFPDALVSPPTTGPTDQAGTSARRLTLGDEQHRAMAAFARPRGSVVVTGFDAARGHADRAHHVRMVMAWPGIEHAYLARQSPGTSVVAAGDIAITRHRVADIMRTVMRFVPPAAAGPGRLPSDSAVRFAARPLAGNTTVTDVVLGDDTPSAANAFGPGVPVGRCGSIVISAGSLADGYAPSVLEARYRDVIGDGRYVLVVDRPGFAAGADGESLVRVLNSALNLNRQRHDIRVAEREEFA